MTSGHRYKKNPKYTNCRHLCPHCTMRISKSSDHWSALGTMSNFEKRNLRSGHLTRAWPGSNAIDRGGAYNAPPQANSQTNDRSETGEAVLERFWRDGSKALLIFFFKRHVSGQGQVKGKNWAFQHFGSQNRQLDSNRPIHGQNTLKG